MEIELRRLLHSSSDEVPKESTIKTICANEDVLFYWSIIGCNWEEEAASSLLQLVIEHWLTVRGFSFTSAFMKNYKQKQKKSVQKSKGFEELISLGRNTYHISTQLLHIMQQHFDYNKILFWFLLSLWEGNTRLSQVELMKQLLCSCPSQDLYKKSSQYSGLVYSGRTRVHWDYR